MNGYRIVEVKDIPKKGKRETPKTVRQAVEDYVRMEFKQAEIIMDAPNYNNLRRRFQQICDLDYPNIKVLIRGNRIFLRWER